MKNITLDDLHLFARLASLGSLSALARERNVAVSQISRALQRIEAACGVQLVLRTTHGLSLTPEGESLQQHCLRIIAELDALEADLDSGREGVSGLVRVSMSSVIAQYLMVDSLPSLHERHPQLRIDFRVDDDLVDMAREGIDIAIRTGEPTTDTLVLRKLGRLERHLYASPAYLARRGVPQAPEDLRQHDLISNSLHPHLNLWRFRSDSGEESVIDVASASPFASDSTATLASFALAGLGIARLVSVVGEPLVREGRLAPVLEAQSQPESVAVNAVMLAGKHRLPKIRACLEHWASRLSA